MKRLACVLMGVACLATSALCAIEEPTLPKGVKVIRKDALTGKDAAGLTTVSSFTLSVWIEGVPKGALLTSGKGKVLDVVFDDNATLSIKGKTTHDLLPLAGRKLDGWHHWAFTFDNIHPLFRVRYCIDGRPALNTYPDKYWPTNPIDLKGATLTFAPDMKNATRDFRLYASEKDGAGALTPQQVAALAGKPWSDADLLSDRLAVRLPKGAFKDTPLVTVLCHIREQSRLLGPTRDGVRIFIDEADIEMKPVTIDVTGQTVRDALAACAKLGGLTLTTEAPDIVRLVKK